MAKETQPQAQPEAQSDQTVLPYATTAKPSYRPRTLQRNIEINLVNEASKRGRASLALMHNAITQVKELTSAKSADKGVKQADLLLVMNRVPGTSERKPSTIVVGEYPEQTKELIQGIYSWIGAQEVARETSEENPDEIIIWRRGRYNAKDIFVRERQMLRNPDFGHLPTLEVTLMAEDAEDVVIEEPAKGKAHAASGILLDRIINTRKDSSTSSPGR